MTMTGSHEPDHRPPVDELPEALRGFPVATIYEAAGKLGDMDRTISAIVPGAELFGLAYTVKGWPGDGLAFLTAAVEAPPGSVLVIDAGGPDCGSWGGSVTLAARNRALAGVVTNGSVRDVRQIREAGFPTFAAGVSVRGAVRHHPGWSGIAVSVGGVSVSTGDLVIGDDDAVVVVPRARVAAVLEAAVARRRMEEDIDAKLKAGGDFATLARLGGAA